MYTRIGSLKLAIILLTVATAVIHIVLAIPDSLYMFYLNGLGYLILLVAFFLPSLKNQQNIIRLAFILYAGITILAWIFIGERSVIGFIDKFIEIALIIILILDMRQTSMNQSTM